MRCHICDKPLSDKEIKFDKRHDEFNPCGVCLEAIAEVYEDEPDDDQYREGYWEPEEEEELDASIL